jgi:Flp pilus assembly protein TadD
MPGLISPARNITTFLCMILGLLSINSLALAQRPDSGGIQMPSARGQVVVTITVRDSQGAPLVTPANVRFYSLNNAYDVTSMTGGNSNAGFSVSPGDYQVEVRCDGYQKATEQVYVAGLGSGLYFYVFLNPSANTSGSHPANGTLMTPQLQSIIDKGLEAMHRRNYDVAKKQFQKGVQLAPGNPELAFLLGTAEFCLQHLDLARKSFERAVNLDPNYEKALLALGELQLAAGETNAAIVTLEKALTLNASDWRVHLVLASAYWRVGGRLAEAGSQASRAVKLAGEKGGVARLLLGEIQYAQGKALDARKTWQQLVVDMPADPSTPAAKRKLADSAKGPEKNAELSNLPITQISTETELPSVEEDTAWAPPDTDKDHPITQDASCATNEILDRAFLRLKTQLKNFERFTATERIEHQEIDRHGNPGKIKTHDFSYVVFVIPYLSDSFYLEENRDGGVTSFPTSLATMGLNSLGVSLLQPADQINFHYNCEGLTNLRGEAVWQIRFEERKMETLGVRRWKKNGMIYNVPFKGRIWIAAANYEVARVETDLITPINSLQLTRDHLRVDYGPVKFDRGNETLWLPWNAEMFIELHGKRYHHRHYLGDYKLFEVDIANRISKPKEKLTQDQ